MFAQLVPQTARCSGAVVGAAAWGLFRTLYLAALCQGRSKAGCLFAEAAALRFSSLNASQFFALESLPLVNVSQSMKARSQLKLTEHLASVSHG